MTMTMTVTMGRGRSNQTVTDQTRHKTFLKTVLIASRDVVCKFKSTVVFVFHSEIFARVDFRSQQLGELRVGTDV